jgi:hypothetical protein
VIGTGIKTCKINFDYKTKHDRTIRVLKAAGHGVPGQRRNCVERSRLSASTTAAPLARPAYVLGPLLFEHLPKEYERAVQIYA